MESFDKGQAGEKLKGMRERERERGENDRHGPRKHGLASRRVRVRGGIG